MRFSKHRTLVLASGAILLTIGITCYQLSRAPQAAANKSSTAVSAKPRSTAAGPVAGMEDWNAKIEAVTVDGFRDLMELALQINDPALRLAVVTSLVDKWLLEDASGFNKYWAALEVHSADRSLAIIAEALQVSLTKLDPERATSDEIFVVLQRLISYLAGTDPEKALVWAKKYLLEDTLQNALVSIARGMAHRDIAKSLEIIEGMTSPLRRSQALALVGAVWASKDSEAALKWAIAMGNHGERALVLNSMLLVMAQQDPSGAADALKSQAIEISEAYKVDRAKELASKNLTEADLAEDSAGYKEALEAGNVSPPMSPDTELMADAGKVIGKLMADGNPAAAAEWALSLPGDYLKLKSLAGVLDGWAKTSPQEAIAFVNQNYPSNSELYNSIYDSWAAADSAAAGKGLSLIADPTLRSLALERVVNNMTAKGNSSAAMDLIAEMPAADVSDGVKLTLVNGISQKDPQLAFATALTIGNESSQYRALKNAFSNLVIQDPQQAGALLKSTTTLSNDTTARLQDLLDAVVGN